MKTFQAKRQVERRAFLRGAAGATLALPFLESLPERSAWGQDEQPVFALYLCAVCGVVPSEFFPLLAGPLTTSSLAEAGKATSALAEHADDLLFVSGVNWSSRGGGDAHVDGFCHALTAMAPTGGSIDGVAAGPSADVVIASQVHPELEPITLLAGDSRGSVGPKLSWAGPGELRMPEDNPYTFYLELMGLVAPGGTMASEAQNAARLLAESRNSIHDLVRGELTELRQSSRMSVHDRHRLDQHLEAVRDVEVAMSDLADEAVGACSAQGLELDRLEALENYTWSARSTDTEDTLQLHMSLVAMAFACNYRRAATIQWGEGYDRTVYEVPSNTGMHRFSHICHRVESDGGSGPAIPYAEEAHAEIDALRMQSLARGLDHFKARGLEDQSFVMWTNHFLDGPAHSFNNIPHIVWGSAGGYLKQGQYIDVGGVTNGKLHNTLISAAIRDTGVTEEAFGDGDGGQIEEILA